MNPSPYDRMVAFIRDRYRRVPVATVGIGIAVLWSVWVVYWYVDHRSFSHFGWYLWVQEAVRDIGAGVVLVAGVIWLIDVVVDPPARSARDATAGESGSGSDPDVRTSLGQ